MSRLLRLLVLFVGVLSVRAPAALAGGAPQWLQDLAATPAAPPDSGFAYKVLLRERTLTIGPGSRGRIRERGAVRVLAREGADDAMAFHSYDEEGGKPGSFRAWLIAGEKSRSWKEGDATDMASLTNLRGDVRWRMISAAADATPGSTFGWDLDYEEPWPLAQADWDFQGTAAPVSVSRLILELPAGWSAIGSLFGHGSLSPVRSADTWTWELQDLPGIHPEPFQPNLDALTPRLGVSFSPPTGSTTPLAAFPRWSDVAAWLGKLQDSQAEVTPAIDSTAHSLTRSAGSSPLDHLRAVGGFVQRLPYVSVRLGLAGGAGYRPRAASRVLREGYGDCKDKANLCRALLKALGDEAWLVGVHHDDPQAARAEWPTPLEFDHCILAMRLRGPSNLPAATELPGVGPVLFFDPTDAYTVPGELPVGEQGGLALVTRGPDSSLVRLPAMHREANRLERRVDMEPPESGDLTGVLHERALGPAAVTERQARAAMDEAQFRGALERALSLELPGLELRAVAVSQDSLSGVFQLRAEFTAPGVAQHLGDELAVRGLPLSYRSVSPLPAKSRLTPIEFPALSVTDTLELQVPAHWILDGAARPETASCPAAACRTMESMQGRILLRVRTLDLDRGQLPSESYAAVRRVFELWRAPEAQPILLKSGE